MRYTAIDDFMILFSNVLSENVLRRKADIMGGERALFDKEFRNLITKVWKAKSQTMAILKPVSKPFWSDPSSIQQRNGGGRVNFSSTEKDKLVKHRVITKVNRSKQAPLFNKVETTCILTCTDLENVHPVIRQLFAGKTIAEIPLTGCIKYFPIQRVA